MRVQFNVHLAKSLGNPMPYWHLIFDGGHEVHDESAWEVVKKRLQPEAEVSTENQNV